MVIKIRKLCTSRQNAKVKFTKIWRLLAHSALLWNRFDSVTRQFIRQQQSSCDERKVLKNVTQPWSAIQRTFNLRFALIHVLNILMKLELKTHAILHYHENELTFYLVGWFGKFCVNENNKIWNIPYWKSKKLGDKILQLKIR